MTWSDEPTGGLQVLNRAECLTLLQTVPIGRIAFTVDVLPAVQPVNFVLHGGSVVIRTRAGSKLDAAIRNTVVAFQADEYDGGLRNGWSVTVVGRAGVVTDPALVSELARLPLRPWAPGERDHFVVISIGIVNGRRLISMPPDAPSQAGPPKP